MKRLAAVLDAGVGRKRALEVQEPRAWSWPRKIPTTFSTPPNEFCPWSLKTGSPLLRNTRAFGAM